jgi:hypothetical protein
MVKRILAAILVGLVINLFCTTSVVVAQQTSSNTRATEEIKSKIVQIGTGPTARIEVRLTDGRKVRGYIGKIEEDHFVIVDESTGAATQIVYQQVQKVKRQKLSDDARKIGKIAALIAVPIVLLLILTPKT